MKPEIIDTRLNPGALREMAEKLAAQGLELQERLVGIQHKPLEERVALKVEAIQYRFRVAMNVGSMEQREHLLDLLQAQFNMYMGCLEAPVSTTELGKN